MGKRGNDFLHGRKFCDLKEKKRKGRERRRRKGKKRKGEEGKERKGKERKRRKGEETPQILLAWTQFLI